MPPKLKKKIFSTKQLQQHNFQLGWEGERRARAFLEMQGLIFLEENYVGGGCEIDLIMWEQGGEPGERREGLGEQKEELGGQGKESREPEAGRGEQGEDSGEQGEKSGELVFVEVKTRFDEELVWASQAVNWKKRRHLQRAGEAYVRSRGLECDWRIDVVVVIGKGKGAKIRHYRNISWEG